MNNNFKVITLTIFSLICMESCNNDSDTGNEKNKYQPVTLVNSSGKSITAGDIVSMENDVESDTLNIEKRLNLAHSYYSGKELDKALIQFKKVFKIDSTNLNSIINIGNVYYDLGRNTEAVEFYKKALKIDKNNLNVKCDMATCIGMSGNLPEAIKILKENIAQNNTHVQSHYNLAVFLEKSGNKEEAANELEIFNSLKK